VAATSASDAVEGKWAVRVHQTQEMKGKEGTGDPGGQETKSGCYSSGSGLCPSGEKAFFADAHQSEVLGLVLPGLRSNIGWILLRIGINMECICVQGIRRTVKKRYGCLPRRCRASRWLPILADSGLKDIKLRWF